MRTIRAREATRRGRAQGRRGSPHLRNRRGRLARHRPQAHALRRNVFSSKPRQAQRRSTSRLAGEVNILNLLAALAAAHARGVPFRQSRRRRSTLNPVPGRFQPVDAGQPFTVIVDYAHTDDALRNLTALARQMTGAIRRARHHALRLRRRPRPHQAPQDGPGRGRRKRLCRRHQRQSALRRSARHPRRDRARPQGNRRSLHHRARPRRRHSSRAQRGEAPATSFSSPAKATRRSKSSPAAPFRSTTLKWRAPRSRSWARNGIW